MKILQVGDSCIGCHQVGGAPRQADFQAGLERAVQAAIDHGVDVFLHTGGLLDEHVQVDKYLLWLDSCFGRLADADIECVLVESQHPLYEIDARVLVQGDHVEVAGIEITTRAEPATVNNKRPVVVAMYGAVEGVAGSGAREPTIDPARLIEYAHTHIALGGRHSAQAIQPNAWYAGATARIEDWDVRLPGGLLIEIGDATGRVLSVDHITWPDRPHRVRTVDAYGMNPDQLADVLRTTLDGMLSTSSNGDGYEHARDHPVLIDRIANLYGSASAAATDGREVYVPSEPIIRLTVRSASCTWIECVERQPMLEWLKTSGGALVVETRWVD